MKRPVLLAASATYWHKFLGVVGDCLLDTFGNGLFFSLIHFVFFLANTKDGMADVFSAHQFCILR